MSDLAAGQRRSFSERLNEGGPVVGTIVTVASEDVAEALSFGGLDWLLIDMLHSPLDIGDVQRLLQVVGNRCYTAVRIPETTETWVGKALDTGCDAIVLPGITKVDDVLNATRAAYYPPAGKRGIGIGRANSYGMNFVQYMKTANDRVAFIVEIQDVDAIRSVEQITELPGVCGVLINPYDLSGTLSVFGQMDHPDVRSAIDHIRSTCREAQMPVGMLCANAILANREIQAGCTFIAVGSDMAVLCATMRQIAADACQTAS